MKRVIFAVLVSVGIFLGVNMVLPFPYGLIIGIGGTFVFSWYWLKKTPPNPSCLQVTKGQTQLRIKRKSRIKRHIEFLKKDTWKEKLVEKTRID